VPYRQKWLLPMGPDLLHDPVLNKGTAFTEAERDALRLRGLLPPRVFTPDEQETRVMENFRSAESNLQKYIFLMALLDRNQTLFYRIVLRHVAEMMPIIYTPTVGEACKRYAHIFRRPRGLYISLNDRGRIQRVLANWPAQDVRIIVVTDGERILGLGDLGADGMGIPIGKLNLYTVCAGVDPDRCLPITLDAGTDNQELLNDSLYIGLSRPRARGAEYDEFIEEFVTAVEDRFPKVILQFEDFGRANAFRLLARYRDQLCAFNDDIQGTGAVALAGLLAASRLLNAPLTEQRLLFVGAGEAGVGIAHAVTAAMVKAGANEADARGRCWMVDSKGLVVQGRPNLEEHKQPFARDHAPETDLQAIVAEWKPTALIGASAQPGIFGEDIVRETAKHCERPIIFALSNPTAKAECTAEQAYAWTDGRALFASGSPFAPVDFNGKTHVPGQGNNAYIFPGVGLGAILAAARHVTDEMFMAAAETLARLVDEASLETGCLYPPLSKMRDISAAIAEGVMTTAQTQGLARKTLPDDLANYVREMMYEPDYPEYDV
jgi:malate dehydrogenase (oxaloacetate-decarboxylating)(NADP+)